MEPSTSSWANGILLSLYQQHGKPKVAIMRTKIEYLTRSTTTNYMECMIVDPKNLKQYVCVCVYTHTIEGFTS